MTTPRHLRILGIRGVPAAHGGFETFAEYLALYLVQRGWRVTVYCQEGGSGPIHEDEWNGVHRVHIPSGGDTAKNTILFDWKANQHAAAHAGLCLTLGYNTAIFSALLRRRGVVNLINMDGIEYSRAKWGWVAKLWFRLNERAGCWLADHLVADHPDIKAHLTAFARPGKITMIPYGADPLNGLPEAPVLGLALEPGKYLTVIARPEPENSLLEIVQGFSGKRRGVKLAVLGRYDDANAYHQAVKQAASSEVRFLGAIYDKTVVQALRQHSKAYVHGHQVGGTNPSLVEALAAGNAVIAHDNRFNRWVAGPGAQYFSNAADLDSALANVLTNPELLCSMQRSSKARFEEAFEWGAVLQAYEALLQRHAPA